MFNPNKLSNTLLSLVNTHQLYFTFSVDGLEEDELKVIEFEGSEYLSNLYEINIKLASSSASLNKRTDLHDVMLDINACLTVYRDGKIARKFFGIVKSFTKKDLGSREQFYELSLVHELERLKYVTDCRIFQHLSILEITDIIFKELRITKYLIDVKNTHVKREYVVMFNESYYDFLTRYWAEEGLIFYFSHDKEDKEERLLLVDDNCLSVYFTKDRPCIYNSTSGGMARENAYIRQFSTKSQIAPTHIMLADYFYQTPSYKLQGKSSTRDDVSQQNPYHYYDYPGRYKATDIGPDFSRTRAESLRNETQTGYGLSDIAYLNAGCHFKLEDHPEIPETDFWLLTKVSHHGKQPQAIAYSRNEGATTYTNSFEVVPSKRQWKAPLPPKKYIYGTQSAIVVGPADEEIYCDVFNRIKVQFHWDQYGAKNENSTAWIRVATFAAGKSSGLVSIPRIGQEVLVSFYDGDPDHPIVTGMGFNPYNMTPYWLPQHKTKTVWRTKTHKGDGFNELSFEDDAGKEAVYIRAQKDMNMLVLHDQTEDIKHDAHTKIENNLYHQVAKQAHYTVDEERRSIIKFEHQTLETRKTIVTQTDSLTVEGTAHQQYNEKLLAKVNDELHFDVGNKIVIEAGTEITLKVGGSFIRIDGSGIYLVGPSVNINGGGTAGTGTPASAVAPLEPLPPLSIQCFEQSIEILHEKTGRPMPFADYKIEFEGGGSITGQTDAEGKATFVTSEKQKLKFKLTTGGFHDL